MSKLFPPLHKALKNSHASIISITSLVIANLLAIYYTIVYHWQIGEVLLLFWTQTVIIMFFSAIKILFYNKIDSDWTDKINDSRLINNKKREVRTRKNGALGFVMAFFIFISLLVAGYLIYFSELNLHETYKIILIPAISLFINHLISFLVNSQNDSFTLRQILNITWRRSLVIIIIPFFYLIVYGVINFISFAYSILSGYHFVKNVNFAYVLIIIFMVLKMIIDVAFHISDHMNPPETKSFKNKA